MRVLEIPPKPSSLIESMRSIGYSLGTALADLVDNSLAAQAETIKIMSSVEPFALKLGFLDNGCGMTEEELLEAMRLGSRSPLDKRDDSDLGRFGLGLKTASFSQCRVLTVVTRVNGATASAKWDLDHIAESGTWQVQMPDDLGSIPWAESIGNNGTLVVWEKLDLGTKELNVDLEIADFVRQLDEACSHLELVFHRYLSGEPGCRKIAIEMNNRPLEPFDPFHISHSATTSSPIEQIRVGNEIVQVQAFTLPHHGKVTPAEWKRYAGPRGYVRNQGFYVYREKRLIIYGTWFGLVRQTELTKLARVRVDMPKALDKAWKIDIKKASAQLPPPVRERLRRIIESLGAASKTVYRSRGHRLTEENPIPVWSRVQNKNEIIYRVNDEHPMIVELQSRLPPQDRSDLLRIVEIVGASLPMDSLFADLGGELGSTVGSATSEQSLRYVAQTTFNHLRNLGEADEDIVAMMKMAEPFRSNWERTAHFLMDQTIGETSDG